MKQILNYRKKINISFYLQTKLILHKLQTNHKTP